MAKSIYSVVGLKDLFSPKLKEIAKNLNTTEQKLKAATNTIKKFQGNLASAASAAATAGAAMVAAGAAGAFALVKRTADAADRIDELSQMVGMSRKGFQEWEYILAQNGVEIDKLQMGMKALVLQANQAMTGNKASAGYFRQLGVSIKDVNGNVKNQEQLFEEVIVAMTKMRTGTQKAYLANMLFSRSGSQLMPILNGTADYIAEMKEEAARFGVILNDETIDAGAKFADTLVGLKSIFGALGLVIGAGALPALQGFADTVKANFPKIKEVAVGAVSAVAGAVRLLVDNMSWLIPVAGGALTAILAYKAINGVIAVITTLRNVIAAVNTVQGIWNALLLANPIGLIAVGVGALVGVIALLIINWDKVTAAAKKAFATMSKIPGLSAIGHAGGVLANFVAPKKTVPGHALGTSYFQGGLTRINEGERGEALVLPSGARIESHDVAKKSSRGNITINLGGIRIDGNVLGNEEYANYLGGFVTNKVMLALANI